MGAPGPTLAEPKTGSRRPSRWRKLLRLAITLTLAGLGSLVIALVLLHTALGRGAAKGFLERHLGPALGVELHVGTLEYRLWAGTLDASALHLAWKDGTLDVASARVRWSPRGGLALHLVRPIVVVRDSDAPKALAPAIGLAARPWTALERFGRVEIASGRVELQDLHGTPYLVLDPADATMQEHESRRAIQITLRDGVVTPPGGRKRLQQLSGTAGLRLDGGSLLIDALHLETEGSTADLQGVLDRLQPNEGAASLRIDADGALAAFFSPDSNVSGRIRAQADLQLKGSLRGQLRASSPALTVQGVGPWDASLRGRFDSGRMEVEWAEALGYGGRFTAKGPISLDERSATDLVLRATDVDAATLARTATGARLPIRSRLQASMRWTTTGFDLDRARGEGEVTLQPLAASTPGQSDASPGLPLSGKSKLLIEGRSMQLRELHLEARGAIVDGELAFSPKMDLRGRYRAELPLESLPALAADLGTSSSLPTLVGRLVAEGEIGGKSASPSATVRLRGEGVSTAAAAARTGTAALEGDGRYAGGRLTLASLVVRPSGGGEAVLAGGVPLTPEGGDWDLRGEFHALDLAPFLAASGIDGNGPLDGRVQVTGPRSQPTARADLDARLSLAGASEPIAISLSGSSTGTRLAVERLEAVLAGGQVQAKGSLDTRSRAIEASATAESVRLARLPMLPAFLQGLDGTLAADLVLTGRTDAPVGELHGTLAQASFGESPLPGLTLTARADGRRLDVVGASLDPARPGDESVFLRGGGPLQGDWPLQLQVDTAALPLQQVLDAIPAARQQQASLLAQGVVTIDVPLRRPKDLRYASEGLAASGHLGDVEWQTERFRIDGTTEEATVSGLRLTTASSSPASRPTDRDRGADAPSEPLADVAAPEPAAVAGGTLAIDGRIAFAPTRSFDLAIEGGLDLAALRSFTDSRGGGTAQLRLRVRGTGAAPDLQGELEVKDGRGRYGALRVSGVQLLARFQGAQAGIERFEAGMLGGRLTASGSVPLRSLPAGSPARLHFEATDLDLSRLAISRAQRGPDTPSFLVSLVGDVEASAPDLEAVRGRGRFTRIEEQSPEGRITLAAPAEWTLERGRLEQRPLRLVGPLGTLEARAELRLAGGPFAGSAVVAGPFDLRVVGPFLEDATLAGPARIDLRASWGPKGVRLDGGLTVEDGRLTLEQLAFTVSQLAGEVRLLGDRATVAATAASGDGRLSLSGGMTFGPRLLGPAQLSLDAQRVLISYPEGFRGRASGGLRLSGEPGTYRITGDLKLAQAYYTADFDQKKQSLDRLEWQLAALQGSVSVGDSLPLSVRVGLSEPLRIRNSRAQLDVVGEFTASGTLSQPTASGQVSLLEGGEIRIRRGDLRIQQGRVELNGYPAGNPELDVTGSSQISGIEMDVRARGTFEDLQLDITSPNRPDLSQTDLVSLLLTGRTAQTAAAQSTAIVAEELASALGGALQKNVGELLLVDVGPERSLLTDDVDPTQRFNLGARLRQDLIVLYSTRLDGTEQRWIVEWNPRGGRLRLRALHDQVQGLAFEIAHRTSFDVFRKRRAAGFAPRELSRLAALRIVGDTPVPAHELLKATGLKVGRGESALRFEQAADRVRTRLVAQGWRGATVNTESAPAAKDPRSVELTLRVDAGPRIRISWTGDSPGKSIATKALATWPAYASPESAATVVARTARVLLQADRYYLAKVEQEVHKGESETVLTLRVERGPRGKGVSVDFDGNTVLDDAALLAVLPKPGSREFFEALAGRGNRLSTPLRVAYAQVGHLRTRALRPRSEFDAATGRLQVVIPIRERAAARVSELALPRELRDAGAEAPPLTLREGQPFDLDAYITDRDAVAAWYRDAGWMEARVRGVLEPAGDDIRVRLEVAPGPRPLAGEVRIESSGRSRPGMIRRAVVVERGAPIRPQQLAESRARLSELGIFRSVDVRPVPSQELSPELEAVSDIVVSYVERPDVTLEYGLRYSRSGAAGVGGVFSSPDNGRLQLAGAVELANPLGWGWRLRPFALLTSDRHTFGTALESATLFGLRVRTQLLVFDDDDNRVAVSSLASRIRGVSIQQTRALVEDSSPERRHDRLRLQWGYADKRIQYFDSSGVETSLAGKRSYLGLSLAGDERDSLTDPRRGLFWSASSELSRKAFGSDVDYLRLYGQLFLYLPLPGRLVWAQGYRAGVAPGENPLLLLENRFQAGGPTTVRGYDQHDLGPQTQDGIGFGGQGLVILNQELRFPIWRFVSGGVFWDAGNVWATAGDVSLGDLRQSVGFGLRVMLPFGPIRAEYAWNVGRNREGRRGRFVLGLGHAF